MSALEDKIADIQLKLGLDDTQWYAKFKNEKGLLGAIEPLVQSEVEGFAERLHKRCDVCAGTHAVRMSNTGWHEPADAEPCDEDVHTYVEAELGKYREGNR